MMLVVPAQAGTSRRSERENTSPKIPAFAGMTVISPPLLVVPAKAGTLNRRGWENISREIPAFAGMTT